VARRPRRCALPPILDYEWDWKGGCPPYGTVADVRTWLTKVRAAFGRTPLVYTSRAFVAGRLGGTTEVAAGGNQLQVATTARRYHRACPPAGAIGSCGSGRRQAASVGCRPAG
jgi:lysozyme